MYSVCIQYIYEISILKHFVFGCIFATICCPTFQGYKNRGSVVSHLQSYYLVITFCSPLGDYGP